MSKDPKSARISGIEVSTRAKKVWIEVDSYEALLGYKHEYDQYTLVTASKTCSEEDLTAIKAHCKDTMFMTFEKVATDDGASGSASVETKNEGVSSGHVEEKTSKDEQSICSGHVEEKTSKDE